MNFEPFYPYAFALLIAVPLLVLLRLFVFTYINLKNKELEILSVKSNNVNNLQAYERMTLFLERLKPSNLVAKFNSDLNVHEYIFLLEKSISEEYDYNSSQQLYISKNSWQNIVESKNAIIKLLHSTHENLGENADLKDFKTVFLMNYVEGEDFISDSLQLLKKDALFLTAK